MTETVQQFREELTNKAAEARKTYNTLKEVDVGAPQWEQENQRELAKDHLLIAEACDAALKVLNK